MDIVYCHNLCRTCARQNIDMTPITSTLFMEDQVVTLSEMLEPFIDKPKFDFPTVICHLCVKKAIAIHNFKLLCVKSTTYFQNCIKNDNSKCINIKHTSTNTDSVANKYLATYKLEQDISETNALTDDIVLQDFDNSNCKNIEFNNNHNNTTYYIRKAKNHETSMPGNESNECNSEIGTLSDSNIPSKGTKHEQRSQPIHIDGDLFFCAECNKSFKSKYILISHVRRHRNKGQFLCTVCGKGFNAQSCLLRHGRIHTGEKNYECEECHKKFPSSNNLKLHSRRHTGVKPYLCTLCGKCFSHPTGLTYHNRTHTKEKPYACDVCDRRFTIQCHRERHRKTHSGERPFACDMCDRAFIKKFDLQRHQDVHLGNKPYTCSICEKSFVRKMHLDYHMMVHTKERPHVCSHCGKGFIRRYYLTSHIKKHHVLDIEEQSNYMNVQVND